MDILSVGQIDTQGMAAADLQNLVDKSRFMPQVGGSQSRAQFVSLWLGTVLTAPDKQRPVSPQQQTFQPARPLSRLSTSAYPPTDNILDKAGNVSS